MGNYSKRDERSDFIRKGCDEIARAKKRKRAIWSLLTLRTAMEKPPRWMWFICPRCRNRRPVALAQFAIRYPLDVPLADVAKFTRCGCGHVGALTQIPATTWQAGALLTEPFPAELATLGLERWIAPRTRTRKPALLIASAMCRPNGAR